MVSARDAHGQWSREVFHHFCGPDEQALPAASIRRRSFATWLRKFMGDMVVQGHLPPAKAVRTARVISILFAKARSADDGCLTAAEFDACTRVVSHPYFDGVSLEADIAWSLYDIYRAGSLSVADYASLGRLWADLGVVLEGGEDGASCTAEVYYRSFSSLVASSRVSLSPRRAATAPSAPSRRLDSTFYGASRIDTWVDCCGPTLMPSRPFQPQDHVQRSMEVASLSLLAHKPLEQPMMLTRPLTPSRPSKPKHPGKTFRGACHIQAVDADRSEDAAVESATTPRLPVVRKALDWDKQEACWTRRDNRLRPYMRVKATYQRPDGSKKEAHGTLLNGWGQANAAANIPHSTPPQGARLGDSRRELGDSLTMSTLPTSGIGDEPIVSAPPPEQWREEVRKWKDSDNNVIVLIHGTERLVPRELVAPCHDSGSPRSARR